MDTSFEDQVRERAYHIWMSAGMEDGMAHEHWARAEQAVVSETVKPVKKASAKKVATKVADKAPAKKTAAKASEKKATARTSKAKH